jgi:hypothetical protein
MARRVGARRGDLVPQLAEGLRAGAERLREGHPGMAPLPIEQALDRGDPIILSGGLVAEALARVDPAGADSFRRAHGWRAGEPYAHRLDKTQWQFDPSTACLQACEQTA